MNLENIIQEYVLQKKTTCQIQNTEVQNPVNI